MSSFRTILCVLIASAVTALAHAADKPPVFNDTQKAAIEDIVRDQLTKKEPDIIIKAAQEMQNRQEAETSAKSQEAIAASRDKLFKDPNSFVGGNPKGDVNVVEFFDYQCGYCKVSQEAVQKLLGSDKNVRLIYKEFPILGPNSVQAAKASIASAKQGKYVKFHEALMTDKEHISDEVIFKVAKSVGLDVEKLKKDMADPAIEKAIKANQELGGEIGAHGTPTFVVGEQIYPGAMQYEALKEAVDAARKSGKK